MSAPRVTRPRDRRQPMVSGLRSAILIILGALPLACTDGTADAPVATAEDAAAEMTPSTQTDAARADAVALDTPDGDPSDAGRGDGETTADVETDDPCERIVPVPATGGVNESRPWFDLRLEGRGFDAYDGREIHLRVGTNGARQRVSEGTVTIRCGNFVFSAPAVLEESAYKAITLYLDENEDGTCDDEIDTVWSHTTSVIIGDTVIVLGPGEARWRDGRCLGFP